MDYEDLTPDMATGLQLQQFLDEWHYRILHSGLAATQDRNTCVLTALSLFEPAGLVLSPGEKEALVHQDEAEMAEALVAKMPAELKRNFEHLALQLQLVISTATRVRSVLDEGTQEQITQIMEEGDSGVTQVILKQAITEAAAEVAELRETHEGWHQANQSRVLRLQHASQTAEEAQRQLSDIQSTIAAFPGQQKAKSKQVLLSLCSGNDKMLVHTAFSSWHAWKVKYVAEKDMHLKFQKELEDAQNKLIEYKQEKVKSVRRALARSGGERDTLLQQEVVAMWRKCVVEMKDERESDAKVKAQQDRLKGMMDSQKENAKKTMARLSSGNDSSLKSMCYQAWSKGVVDLRKERYLDEQVKRSEKALREHMEKKNKEAKGVLARMTGASDTGLLHSMLQAWIEDFMQEKKARELEELMLANQDKFKSLNERQKANACGKAARAGDIEDETLIMDLFMNWVTYTRIERIVQKYSTKMESNKNQLEKVQSMFKSFANQLEQGMNNTPRTNRKSDRRSSSRVSGERPPLPAEPVK